MKKLLKLLVDGLLLGFGFINGLGELLALAVFVLKQILQLFYLVS